MGAAFFYWQGAVEEKRMRERVTLVQQLKAKSQQIQNMKSRQVHIRVCFCDTLCVTKKEAI